MSELNDCELERLSNLFASGSMRNARAIARLLRQEVGEQPKPSWILQALVAAGLSEPAQ
jgi:hypothetical protein